MTLRAPPKYLLLILVAVFFGSLLAFAYVGHFTRYMADDYCLADKVHKLGFINAQTSLYMTWTGRYSYGFLMSLAELIGPSTVPIGPLIALICWLGAATWSIYQLALITRWPHPLLTASLLAELIIFAMLNSADNIVQSFYWQNGIINFVVPLILLMAYSGIISYAVRKHLSGRAAFSLLILAVLLTFIAAGLTEAYGVLQTTGILLSLIIGYKYASNPARRAMFPFLLAGLVSSLLALSIVTLAPGNKFRQSYFPPHPNLFRLTKLSLYYATGFVITEFIHAPLTILSLLLLPFLLAICFPRSRSDRDQNPNVQNNKRALLLLPPLGFFLILICFATGVYAVSGALPERARFIPEFIFVCTAACWAYFAGVLAARFLTSNSKPSANQAAGLVAVAALILVPPLLATRRTLRLVPGARAGASIWDQMDRDMRAPKARGAKDVIVPAVDDVETRLGARRTELQIDHDPNNWKNQCVALYYGVDSVAAR